jgi:hypothetical protein
MDRMYIVCIRFGWVISPAHLTRHQPPAGYLPFILLHLFFSLSPHSFRVGIVTKQDGRVRNAQKNNPKEDEGFE